jgi:phosphatidylglycerol---prolipoprotein diacylglyceryl transferase
MFTITLDPIILHIGHFVLRWYAVILITAMSVGIWLTAREAERKGFKQDDIYGVALWIIFAGILGARLFHVMDHWSDEYAMDPVRALYIWEGGLAIWGALVGGLVAGAVICWRNKWSFLRLLDGAAPGLVLAQAVGRIACVITGDAMGKPTTGPFGFAYASPNALVPKLGVFYTPMPVYEIIVNLLIFAIIWQVRERDWRDGKLFFVYLILYSIERFFLAFTSSYKILAFGLTQSQIIAVVAFTTGLAVMAWMSRKTQQTTFQRSK